MTADRFFLWITFACLSFLAVLLVLALIAAVVRRRDPGWPVFDEWRREQAENARAAHPFEDLA